MRYTNPRLLYFTLLTLDDGVLTLQARYTLATKLNSTRSTLLKVGCCRSRQQISKKSTAAVYVQLCFDTFNSVASVYGAKARRSTLSTFNKVVRVEFIFVASVYWALERRGNYSVTSNDMKLVHCLLTGGLLHLVQRGGEWAGPQRA